MDFLINLDSDIFLFFNSHHNEFFDNFMKLFSGRWIWIPMYACLLLAVVRMFTVRQALAIIMCVALLITLADQTCATFIRPYVERLRPSNPENPLSALTHIVNGYRGGSYGFPSCHAANSFALATFISLVFTNSRLKVAIFLWAIITCYSRVYLGVHYPGDLLVGAIIGAAWGVVCARLLRYIAFSGKKISYAVPSASNKLFSLPSGPIRPLISLANINFRYTDMLGAALAATSLYIAIHSMP